MDPNSLKIKSVSELDSRGIFVINSIDISETQMLSIVYSKYSTVSNVYGFNPQTQKFENSDEIVFPVFKRFERCEFFQEDLICVNSNTELVSFSLMDMAVPRYFPLDSSENDLRKSFKQVDEEDQFLLLVPQMYATDDNTFRISVFNYNKFTFI